MFERFTERARQVVVLAQQEARNNQVRYIGPEHILAGIVLEEEGLAARVLASFDVTKEAVRKVVQRVSEGEPVEEGDRSPMPFTPRAKLCLELALREALSLGHNYIGTEHVLLGLIREGSSDANANKAVTILNNDFGVGPEKIRNEVIRMLSGPKQEPVTKHERDLRELQGQLEALIKKTKLLQHMIESAVTLGRQYPGRPAEAIAKAVIALHDDI